MDALKVRRKLDPLDLEIIDRVYDVACAYVEARDLYRDPTTNADESGVLGRQVFAVAYEGPIDFDTLCDRVLAGVDQY